tara:strand:+ start:651 stop:815 length:165 start_codon:yes stop_codon:yes gene_type:complete
VGVKEFLSLLRKNVFFAIALLLFIAQKEISTIKELRNIIKEKKKKRYESIYSKT